MLVTLAPFSREHEYNSAGSQITQALKMRYCCNQAITLIEGFERYGDVSPTDTRNFAKVWLGTFLRCEQSTATTVSPDCLARCSPTVELFLVRCASVCLKLRKDERFEGKIKWYINPIGFGGDPKAEDNITWVTLRHIVTFP